MARLLAAERQGPEAVAAVQASIQGVLDQANRLRQAASRFGPSHAELQQMARDAKATGAGCRLSGRSLEDCYKRNPRAARAEVYAGWKDMNDYMAKQKLNEMAPPPDEPKPEPAAEEEGGKGGDKAGEKNADKAKSGEKPAEAAKADKPAH